MLEFIIGAAVVAAAIGLFYLIGYIPIWICGTRHEFTHLGIFVTSARIVAVLAIAAVIITGVSVLLMKLGELIINQF